MDRLSPLFCLPGPENRNKDLCEAVGDDSRAIRLALLRQVNRDVSKLVLASSIGSISTVVEDFYSR